MADETGVLYPYQRRYLQDASRFKAGMWSRQTGKTFTTTLEAVLDALEAEATGRIARWTILSISRDRALDAMETGVKLHLRAFKASFIALDVPFYADETAHMVKLPGGSYIRAVAARPETARGMSDNLILDEFAHHHDSRKIWTALFPVISKPDLKLRVISTPNGKGNKFHELMTGDAADGWSRHTTDIYQAVADGLNRNIEELRRGAGDEDLWAQEFELKWLDETHAWLDFELIAACEHFEAGQPERYTGQPVFVGVDIAVKRDLFVIWVVEQVGDVLWTREIIERKGASFAEQDMLLDDVFRRYTVARCCMDETGMGSKPVEDAKRRHGGSRVEGVWFSQPVKLTLATQGKAAFEDRKIRIPEGNPALRADLHKLKKVTGPTGAPRFVAESDAAGHADRTWACFLAINAAQGSRGGVCDGFYSIPRRGGNDIDDSDELADLLDDLPVRHSRRMF